MPYIHESKKEALTKQLIDPDCAGDLNFLFTSLILKYLENKGESYQTYNDAIGALEGCKLELYRRKVVFYENKKINENGDVYGEL